MKRRPRPLFERHHEPMLPRRDFIRRLFAGVAWASAFIGVSLAIGVVGYHVLDDLPWVDALLNASMILGGMGPVDTLKTDAAKLFASAYALYSGVMLITSIGVVIAPIVHRFLHHFHLQTEDDDA
jgi:hypothetical protein